MCVVFNQVDGEVMELTSWILFKWHIAAIVGFMLADKLPITFGFFMMINFIIVLCIDIVFIFGQPIQYILSSIST